MKRCFWLGAVAWVLAGPARAQSLAGEWQGVESTPGEEAYWPSVLRVQAGKGQGLFGILYEEVGGQPETTVTFQMAGARTAAGLRLDYVRTLDETRPSGRGYWCRGSITFTYDASQEKLIGHASYRPINHCDTGIFTLYRIRLKSAARVPAGALSTLRVSGRDVRWFADPELKQPLATGNTYPTRLRKTTTFYLTQGFYATAQRSVVPIVVQVSGASPVPKASPKPAPLPARAAPPPVAAAPAPPLSPATAAAPQVLPTVLFRVTTAELLPEASPALDQLAATLKAQPMLRLRVAGHTDHVGESDKNQLLSEQRAAAVKAYLVQAGIAAERLTTIGYGDKRPLYPSPDARNRRVEVQLLK